MSNTPNAQSARQRVPRDRAVRDLLAQYPLSLSNIETLAAFNEALARGHSTITYIGPDDVTRIEQRIDFYDINADGEINNNDNYDDTLAQFPKLDEKDYDAFHLAQDESEALRAAEEAQRQEAASAAAEEFRKNWQRILRRAEAERAVSIVARGVENPYSFANTADSILDKGRFIIESDVVIDRDQMTFQSSQRPEIVSKIPLFLLRDNKSLKDLHELRQFERHICHESLDKDWEKINSNLSTDISSNMQNLTSFYSTKNKKFHSLLCGIKDAMNETIKKIDLKKNSQSITQTAKNYSTALLDPVEGDFLATADSIESFFRDYCGFNVSSNFSNTKLFYFLLREFSNSIRRHSPLLLSDSLVRPDINDSKPFLYTQYLPEAGETHALSTHALGTRNITTIRFSDGTVASDVAGRRCVTRSYINALPGIDPVRRSQDRIKILSSLLHNELSVSSGIGKLSGTSVGNKYGVAGGDPIVNILGGYFLDDSTVLRGAGRSQSFSDLAVLNELYTPTSIAEAVLQSRSPTPVKILPFETLPVIDTNEQTYVPGAKYFVDLPIRQGISNSPLEAYAKKYAEINSSGQIALKTLLTFDTKCEFTPADIAVGCLKIIKDTARRLLDPETSFSEILPLILMATFDTRTELFAPNLVFQGASSSVIDLVFSACSIRRSTSDESSIAQGNILSFVPTLSYPAISIGRLRGQEEYRQIYFEDLRFRPSPNLDDVRDAEMIAAQKNSFNSSIDNVCKNIDSLCSQALSKLATPYPLLPGNLPKIAKFEGKTILDGLITLLRNIQEKVFALQGSQDQAHSYLDDEKFTRFNRWDDNTMLACVFEILRCFVFELLTIKKGDILTSDTGEPYLTLRLTGESRDSIIRMATFLDAVTSTYDQGGNLDDLFDAEGDSRAVLGVSENTAFKTGCMTAGRIVATLKSLIDHRKFMKLSLGYLESISRNFSDANNQLVNFFKTAQDGSDFASIFQDLKNNPLGLSALQTLYSSQNSIREFQFKSNASLPRPSSLKKSTVNSDSEDEVQEFFFEEVQKFQGENNVALCIGLPAGMIESFKSQTLREDAEEGSSIVDASGGLIRLDFNRANELVQGAGLASTSLKFDPEIYILPGDMRFSTSEITGEKIFSLASIVEGTRFTRISNGKIVETNTGKLMLQSRFASYYEVLKNHIVDKIFKNFVQSTFGVALDEINWMSNSALLGPLIDDETYLNIQKMLNNNNVSAAMNLKTEDFTNFFQDESVNSIRRPKSSQQINDLIVRGIITNNSIDRMVKILSSQKLNPLVESQKLICPKLFDRVFIVGFSSEFTKRTNLENILVEFSSDQQRDLTKYMFDGIFCSVDLTNA